MRRWVGWLLVLGMAVPAAGARETAREAALGAVERQAEDLSRMADELWRLAETALRERRSAAVLADYAERMGFTVERGVAGMPTAFVASFGEGRPILGVLGEYDALPGLSQEAVPHKEARGQGGAGHGCGHNLFGPASLGAAVAIKDLIAAGKLHGTIRFYGTPAEEAIGGKTYMAREGLFDDLDAALAWHPDTKLSAETDSSQAMVDFVVEFHGRAAHAAFDPWNGRSASDAAEIFLHALNLMREHVRPTVRMHYTVLEAGDVPNVVPEKARVWCWVRDSKRAGVDDLMPRVRRMVEGAALAADVQGELRVQAGSYEMLPSMAGSRVLYANLQRLGPVPFSEEEQTWSRELQRATGVDASGADGSLMPFEENPGPPEGGSTDVADVSWVVPTVHLTVPTAPRDIPWHSWAVVAASGSPVGRTGMIYASKALATTLVDLYEDPAHLRAMRAEFQEKTAGHVYSPYIPDGPPPVPQD